MSTYCIPFFCKDIKTNLNRITCENNMIENESGGAYIAN